LTVQVAMNMRLASSRVSSPSSTTGTIPARARSGRTRATSWRHLGAGGVNADREVLAMSSTRAASSTAQRPVLVRTHTRGFCLHLRER
jgi:hypothetical protein